MLPDARRRWNWGVVGTKMPRRHRNHNPAHLAFEHRLEDLGHQLVVPADQELRVHGLHEREKVRADPFSLSVFASALDRIQQEGLVAGREFVGIEVDQAGGRCHSMLQKKAPHEAGQLASFPGWDLYLIDFADFVSRCDGGSDGQPIEKLVNDVILARALSNERFDILAVELAFPADPPAAAFEAQAIENDRDRFLVEESGPRHVWDLGAQFGGFLLGSHSALHQFPVVSEQVRL
ncbi:MAG: hypothetical protein NXI16_01340 [Alphaproteobacteria bacterium]|nr:hypothetical protein [Alphaproteobacteria bacterium]